MVWQHSLLVVLPYFSNILLLASQLNAFFLLMITRTNIHRNDLNLDSEQISALSEYVPSEEEKILLSPHLDGQIQLEHSRMSLCEKWMVAISSVQDAEEKLRSMQFMADCPALLEELQLGE